MTSLLPKHFHFLKVRFKSRLNASTCLSDWPILSPLIHYQSMQYFPALSILCLLISSQLHQDIGPVTQKLLGEQGHRYIGSLFLFDPVFTWHSSSGRNQPNSTT
jgi:hypothetical protein